MLTRRYRLVDKRDATNGKILSTSNNFDYILQKWCLDNFVVKDANGKRHSEIEKLEGEEWKEVRVNLE